MLISPNEHSLLLAERWLKLLSDLGRAQATLTAYRNALRHYFAFCNQNSIEPEKARFEDLAAYISPQLPGMLSSGKGLVPRVVKLPRIPDDAQWQAFLLQASTSPLRHRLMLALTYYGALQRSEITSLSIEDLDFANRLIRIRAETTKSRRERIVCYSPAIAPVLAAHLMQMKRKGISEVLCSVLSPSVIRACSSHSGPGAKRYGNEH